MRLKEWITAIGLASALTVPSLAQPQTGEIRVSVKVPGTLKPVPGVQILVSGPWNPQGSPPLLVLPDNEEDLLAYLEELAAARGIIGGDLQISTICPRTYSIAPGTSAAAVTDAEGNATIPNLKMGKYVLKAGREGYVGVQPPQMATVIPPKSVSLEVTVDSGTPTSPVSLFLNPGATVSGRVVDASGAPVENACVQLGLVKQQKTGPTFIPGPRAITDSKGQYRLESVGPGEYVIRAKAPQSDAAITYFPGVREPEKATTLTVETGSDTVRTDFKLP